MSLLTEEQVLDLAEAMVDGNGTTYHRIQKWNEKQPAPIEPNWKKIPSKVKSCHLRQYYFDSEGNEIDWDYLFYYERPVTAHPHAALMAKYAEVAARRVDPWVEFEMRIGSISEWVKCDAPISFSGQEYRYIGETK